MLSEASPKRIEGSPSPATPWDSPPDFEEVARAKGKYSLYNSLMDQEITQITDLELGISQLRTEIEKLPNEVGSPEILRGEDLVFFHESGHATIALLFNIPIDAYNVAGKLGWVSADAPQRKKHYASVKLDGNEGVVSYRSTNLTEQQRKIMSAGGVASELARYGHIGSSTPDQESDRKKGGFGSIFEIQAVADPLADRFDTDLNVLYRFVLNRIALNKGFDDINQLIGKGCKIAELFGIVE